MGLSAIVSWPTGTTAVADRVATTRGVQMRNRSSQDAAERCQLKHPTIKSSVGEIIEHILEVHHRFLRDKLTKLSKHFAEAAGHSPECTKPWNALTRRFSKLRDEMLRCLAHEEAVVFPELSRLERDEAWSNPPPALRLEFETVERRHALCLQLLWRLLRITKDQVSVLPRTEAGRHITNELSALCDDFEQQLFEIECLIFMKLASPRIRRPR